MMSRASVWWNGREPRERQLLLILSAIITVFLIIFVIVLPLRAASTNAESALTRAKADLALVSRLTPSQTTAGPRAPFDRSVLITVARTQDLKLTRVQPGGDGTFAVWIDDAQTQRLYGFFDDLIGSYAVSLERVVVSADANGRLSAQFTVR